MPGVSNFEVQTCPDCGAPLRVVRNMDSGATYAVCVSPSDDPASVMEWQLLHSGAPSMVEAKA